MAFPGPVVGGGVGSGSGPSGLMWGGRLWQSHDQHAFAGWLSQHGSSFAEWSANHPQAAQSVFGSPPTTHGRQLGFGNPHNPHYQPGHAGPPGLYRDFPSPGAYRDFPTPTGGAPDDQASLDAILNALVARLRGIPQLQHGGPGPTLAPE